MNYVPHLLSLPLQDRVLGRMWRRNLDVLVYHTMGMTSVGLEGLLVGTGVVVRN